MSLVDWAATWDAVPDDRPPRVEPVAEQSAAVAPMPRPGRPPRAIVLTLSPRDAHDLPCRLPRLLARTDVRLGDRVTVDLASVSSVHVTGLELLISVLSRRVGLSGDVTLVGGTPGLRAQLRSLGIALGVSPAAFDEPLRGAPLQRTPPAAQQPSPDIPSPRRASDAQSVARTASRAPLERAG